MNTNWPKTNKKLGLFLIVSFLCAQMLTFLHTADYGLEEHEHNGHICEIYLHTEHAKSIDTPNTVVLASPISQANTLTFHEESAPASHADQAAHPRGPPTLS